MTRLSPVGAAGGLAAVFVLGSALGTPGFAGGVGLLAVWYLLSPAVAVAVGQAVAATLLASLGDPRFLWGFEAALAAMLFGGLVADYGPLRGLAATAVALALPGGVAYALATGALSTPAALAVLAALALVGTVWLSLYADRTAISTSSPFPSSGADRDRGSTHGPTAGRTDVLTVRDAPVASDPTAGREPADPAVDRREVAP